MISSTAVYQWELVALWLKVSAMYAEGRGFDFHRGRVFVGVFVVWELIYVV